ncbi:MAG TPA: ABC transporter permease [Rhodanobacteraceae bacterium]
MTGRVDMFVYYLQLAWRRCCRQPSAAALIMLTMAIGIAACMTALTIFAALSGQPLPGVSNHLYVVTMDARTAVAKNGADYAQDSLLKLRDARALVDAGRASAQVALADSQTVVSTEDGKRSDDVSGFLAYGQALRALQVPLRFGRPWTAADQASDAPVVVIDSKLARKLFGRVDAVGRSVEMNHHRFRIIGVTARWKPREDFVDAEADSGTGTGVQLFVPAGAALDAGVGPATSGECGQAHTAVTFGAVNVHACRWLEVWVALDSPVAVQRYQRFITNYADAQHAAGRFVYPPHAKLYGTLAWLDLSHVVPDDVSLNVILAGGFLFLCMINVAGLLTARFLRRQVDAAIRRALGASRRQVFAQHLVEAGLFGVLGGVLALPLAWFGLWVVRQQPVSYAPAAAFRPGTFLVLFALAIGVGLIVGVLPAWRVCRLPPAAQIRQG